MSRNISPKTDTQKEHNNDLSTTLDKFISELSLPSIPELRRKKEEYIQQYDYIRSDQVEQVIQSRLHVHKDTFLVEKTNELYTQIDYIFEMYEEYLVQAKDVKDEKETAIRASNRTHY
jgi:hypothetical protein